VVAAPSHGSRAVTIVWSHNGSAEPAAPTCGQTRGSTCACGQRMGAVGRQI
jgi:hypothetical protein